MPESMFYKLKTPIIGVERTSVGMQVTPIPAGEVLNVPDTRKKSGLVEIDFHGRNLGVYIEDLRARAEIVEAEGA
jgi:hypothetical protein